MNLILTLFGITALGGLCLGVLRMKKIEFPVLISFGHGGLALVSLVLLLQQVFNNDVNDYTKLSALLFVCAALGGLFAVSFHLRKKDLPPIILAGHGGLAVVAYLLLLKGSDFL